MESFFTVQMKAKKTLVNASEFISIAHNGKSPVD